MLADQAAALAVTKNAMSRSVKKLALDEEYFCLVYEAARLIAGFDGKIDVPEDDVLKRLVSAGKAKGWI